MLAGVRQAKEKGAQRLVLSLARSLARRCYYDEGSAYIYPVVAAAACGPNRLRAVRAGGHKKLRTHGAKYKTAGGAGNKIVREMRAGESMSV